jgi:CheY-like chemotaxis protein
MRILVVDDEPAVREAVERALRLEGHDVLLAADGQEALGALDSRPPDAIVLDVLMPGMDGWAVLTALKGDPALAAIPVIMLTVVDDRSLGYALGATDYLTKPVDRGRLVGALRRHHREQAACAVLVVEDDPVSRQLVRELLAREGCTVREAADGRAGLVEVARSRPDLIVLDLLMPELDGFGFVAELRRHPDWRAIPIVVVTAKDVTPEDRRRLNGQVETVIAKGGTAREALLTEVRELLADYLAAAH